MEKEKGEIIYVSKESLVDGHCCSAHWCYPSVPEDILALQSKCLYTYWNAWIFIKTELSQFSFLPYQYIPAMKAISDTQSFWPLLQPVLLGQGAMLERWCLEGTKKAIARGNPWCTSKFSLMLCLYKMNLNQGLKTCCLQCMATPQALSALGWKKFDQTHQ